MWPPDASNEGLVVTADESAILTQHRSSEAYAMSELWKAMTNNKLLNDWLRKGFSHVSFDGIYDKKTLWRSEKLIAFLKAERRKN